MVLKRPETTRRAGSAQPDVADGFDPSSIAHGAIEVDENGIPQWVDRRFPMLFIALGIVSALAVGTSPGDRSPVYGVALVLVAISPWALALVGIRLPDPWFAATVLAPVAFLGIAGESLGVVDLDGGTPQLTLMLVVGVVGQMAAVGSVRLVTTTTVAGLAIVVVAAIVRGDLDFAPWLVGIVLGAGGGRAFRSSIVRLAELRAAQQALADRYLLEERRRIAREVHDIVAHTMSVTMLHITAARLALHRDPSAAAAALEEAERSGRASLDDIRGIVRLLRTDESSLDPVLPADTDIAALVERYRAAGSPIELDDDLTMDALSPDTRLAVYRILQESLSNAVRHGTGEIAARLHPGHEHITITVTNAAPADHSSRPGAGLVGMRERAEALGGTFEAGPGRAGTWRVCARIPT